MKLHVTDYITEEVQPYEYSFNMKKRIDAMIGHNCFIEYAFRDMNISLELDKNSTLKIVENTIQPLIKIRTKLIVAKATKQDINKFDTKIYECFEKTLNIINNRINTDTNSKRKEDMELLKVLKTIKILEYLL
jgi:hypothetical protein